MHKHPHNEIRINKQGSFFSSHFTNMPILGEKDWCKMCLWSGKEGEEPRSVTDGCQKRMKHESAEGIQHECEI